MDSHASRCAGQKREKEPTWGTGEVFSHSTGDEAKCRPQHARKSSSATLTRLQRATIENLGYSRSRVFLASDLLPLHEVKQKQNHSRHTTVSVLVHIFTGKRAKSIRVISPERACDCPTGDGRKEETLNTRKPPRFAENRRAYCSLQHPYLASTTRSIRSCVCVYPCVRRTKQSRTS